VDFLLAIELTSHASEASRLVHRVWKENADDSKPGEIGILLARRYVEEDQDAGRPDCTVVPCSVYRIS
jgi:hypothetical protein